MEPGLEKTRIENGIGIYRHTKTNKYGQKAEKLS